MNGLKAWLEDRKNLPIVLAGTVIILLLVALVFLRMTGTIGGGGDSTSADVGMQDYSSPDMTAQPGTPAPADPGIVPPQGGPVDPNAQPGAPAGQAAQAPVAEATAGMGPMLPYRKDPFMSFSGPPKKTDALMALLPTLSHPRIAPAPVRERTEVEGEDILPPQPFRRMAGVMHSGKVSAIMETNGEADIVRPGSEITRGNSKVRVESIEPNCIILKTLDTKTPVTIRVNMAGSVSGSVGSPGQSGSPIYPNSGRTGDPPMGDPPMPM